MNTVDKHGRSPLMIAVQKENYYMVNFLVGKGASANGVDSKANSVYHYAALTNKDLIQVRISEPASLTSISNYHFFIES